METTGERSVLRDEGCDAIQGFLYGRRAAAEAGSTASRIDLRA